MQVCSAAKLLREGGIEEMGVVDLFMWQPNKKECLVPYYVGGWEGHILIAFGEHKAVFSCDKETMPPMPPMPSLWNPHLRLMETNKLQYVQGGARIEAPKTGWHPLNKEIPVLFWYSGVTQSLHAKPQLKRIAALSL